VRGGPADGAAYRAGPGAGELRDNAASAAVDAVRRYRRLEEEMPMTLCPVALAVGCRKCPAFSICPLKSVIGDYVKQDDAKAGSTGQAKPPKKGAKK
jgi:hypothetical protein